MIVNLDNTTRPRARDNAALQEYLPHPPKEGEINKQSKCLILCLNKNCFRIRTVKKMAQ